MSLSTMMRQISSTSVCAFQRSTFCAFWALPHSGTFSAGRKNSACTRTRSFPSRLGYYSKATTREHLNHPLFTGGHWAGLGVDHNWDLREAFEQFPSGFIQGNFDQNLLLASRGDDFKLSLEQFLDPLLKHDRTGWICGLGHGVLPKTPEENVRKFVNTVREVLQ